jgi:hypothetical protein
LRQVVLGRRDTLEVGDELVVLKDRALGLAKHVREALMLRAKEQGAIGTTPDDLIEPGELGLRQPDVLRCCGHEQILAGENLTPIVQEAPS